MKITIYRIRLSVCPSHACRYISGKNVSTRKANAWRVGQPEIPGMSSAGEHTSRRGQAQAWITLYKDYKGTNDVPNLPFYARECYTVVWKH